MTDPRHRIFKAIGQSRHERGFRNEARVVEALSENKPAWVKSARISTRHEDHNGIDVVVESDVGSLYLQIKSSVAGANSFEPRHNVAVMIVRQHDTHERIRDRAIGHLSNLREKYLKLRQPDSDS